jgi:predicted dehydrogenase
MTVRVGVIGLGVGERHAAGYASHPQAEVAALCDRDEGVLNRVGALYPQARRVVQAKELIADSSLDAVSIASHDADHFAQIMQALENNKHVFAEKPLCLHEDEARAIRRELSARPHLKFSSHFPLRQVPRFRELRGQVAAGKFGRLYLAEVGYWYGRWHKITAGWRGKTPGFSPVLGGGVHLIDLLLWLTGARVAEVFAYGTGIAGREHNIPFADCVVSVLKFNDGMVAELTCDLAGIHPHYHGLSLYGTDATFRNGREAAELFTSRENAPVPVTTAYRQERQEESNPFFATFIDAGLGQGSALVAAEEVFASLSAAFAIMRSLSSGRPEKVDYI